MGFEVYSRRSRPQVDEPRIGIQSRGTLSLNAAAYHMLSNNSASDEIWVELLYDRGGGVVGLRTVEPGKPNAYPVRKQAHADSYLLTGKGFLGYYGIAFGDRLRYYRVHDYGEGIIGFAVESDEIKE